jgi:catechol 2,3-dioxygenase-like lactoylglutathione lyase family enzyme
MTMGLQNASIMPTLGVKDLDRSIRFYSDTLGFNVRRLSERGGSQSAMVEIGSQGRLLLYPSTFQHGETTTAAIIVDDLDGCVREFRDKGVQFEEYDLPGLKTENGIASDGDLRTAWFKDPDGNILALSNETSEIMRRAA